LLSWRFAPAELPKLTSPCYWGLSEAEGEGDGDSSEVASFLVLFFFAGDGDASASELELLLFDGDADASASVLFFLVEVVVAAAPDFLVVDDFFVDVDVLAAVFEDAVVSFLFAQETTNATVTRTTMMERTDFFIGYGFG
jgi:hypothetical protein